MNNRKKCFIIAFVIVGILCTSTVIYAATQTDMVHIGDTWNYGPRLSIWPWELGMTWQYSDFKCPEQNHHATARIAGTDGYVHESRASADPGNWAKAEVGPESPATQWNSYYGHD